MFKIGLLVALSVLTLTSASATFTAPVAPSCLTAPDNSGLKDVLAVWSYLTSLVPITGPVTSVAFGVASVMIPGGGENCFQQLFDYTKNIVEAKDQWRHLQTLKNEYYGMRSNYDGLDLDRLHKCSKDYNSSERVIYDRFKRSGDFDCGRRSYPSPCDETYTNGLDTLYKVINQLREKFFASGTTEDGVYLGKAIALTQFFLTAEITASTNKICLQNLQKDRMITDAKYYINAVVSAIENTVGRNPDYDANEVVDRRRNLFKHFEKLLQTSAIIVYGEAFDYQQFAAESFKLAYAIKHSHRIAFKQHRTRWVSCWNALGIERSCRWVGCPGVGKLFRSYSPEFENCEGEVFRVDRADGDGELKVGECVRFKYGDCGLKFTWRPQIDADLSLKNFDSGSYYGSDVFGPAVHDWNNGMTLDVANGNTGCHYLHAVDITGRRRKTKEVIRDRDLVSFHGGFILGIIYHVSD